MNDEPIDRLERWVFSSGIDKPNGEDISAVVQQYRALEAELARANETIERMGRYPVDVAARTSRTRR